MRHEATVLMEPRIKLKLFAHTARMTKVYIYTVVFKEELEGLRMYLSW